MFKEMKNDFSYKESFISNLSEEELNNKISSEVLEENGFKPFSMYKFTTKLFIGQRQNSLFLLRVNTRDLITSNAKVVINILTENDSANVVVHMEVKDFVFGIRAMSCILAVFAIISSVFLFNSSLTELIITLSILVGLAIGLIIMIRMMKIAFEKDVNKVVSFIKKII